MKSFLVIVLLLGTLNAHATWTTSTVGSAILSGELGPIQSDSFVDLAGQSFTSPVLRQIAFYDYFVSSQASNGSAATLVSPSTGGITTVNPTDAIVFSDFELSAWTLVRPQVFFGNFYGLAVGSGFRSVLVTAIDSYGAVLNQVYSGPNQDLAHRSDGWIVSISVAGIQSPGSTVLPVVSTFSLAGTRIQPAPIPEPASAMLLAAGLAITLLAATIKRLV